MNADRVRRKVLRMSLSHSEMFPIHWGKSLNRSGMSLIRWGNSLIHSGMSPIRSEMSLIRSGKSLSHSENSLIHSGMSLSHSGNSLSGMFFPLDYRPEPNIAISKSFIFGNSIFNLNLLNSVLTVLELSSEKYSL